MGLAVGCWVVIASLSVVDVLAGSLLRTLRVALASVLAAVPPVLHCVVAASLQPPCNLCPPLAHLSYHLLNELPLFSRDGVMVQCWFEVLVIALSALLW
jgi:hypothetical protein